MPGVTQAPTTSSGGPSPVKRAREGERAPEAFERRDLIPVVDEIRTRHEGSVNVSRQESIPN